MDDGDEPIDCQIRYVGQYGYIADDGGDIQFKTHRYLPVPVSGDTRPRLVEDA